MSTRTILILIGVGLAWFWGMVLWGVWSWAKPTERVYDCSMALFHPDIPKHVKQKCREVRT